MEKKKLTGLTIIVFILAIPVIVGLIVSFSFVPIPMSNDWIGFWGSYLGAIIGGLITLWVMRATLAHNNNLTTASKKQELCTHIATLVSHFCIDLLAYRSKWKTLHAQASGGSIDHEKAIELGATKEKPRQIYFELEILLMDIPEAANLLTKAKALLDETPITKKTIQESATLMDDLRQETRLFIKNYTAT